MGPTDRSIEASRVAPVMIGPVTIGATEPAIIVPLMGGAPEELCSAARELVKHPHDVVEWRIDYCDSIRGVMPGDAAQSLASLAVRLREIIAAPLLVTYRTSHEGGSGRLDDETYADLLTAVLRAGIADAVDVEALRSPTCVRRVIQEAHAARVPVIASNHDWAATPGRDLIVERLRFMQEELDADILKIAVMPSSPEDVLTLLAATWDMYSQHATRPLITIAMGPLGVPSRIAGHAFGSAATFCSAGEPSAPGQVRSARLREAAALIPGAVHPQK